MATAPRKCRDAFSPEIFSLVPGGLLVALAFLGGFAELTQVRISGAELTLVRSFHTASVSNSPVQSIAFDPESNVLLLGTEDGAILEATLNGVFITILVSPVPRNSPVAGNALAVASPLGFIYAANGGSTSPGYCQFTRSGTYLGCGAIAGFAKFVGFSFEANDSNGVLHMLCARLPEIYSLDLTEQGFLTKLKSLSLPLDYNQRELTGLVRLPDEGLFILSLRKGILVGVRGDPSEGPRQVGQVLGEIDTTHLGIAQVEDIALDSVTRHLYVVDPVQNMVCELAFLPPRAFHRGDADQDGLSNLSDSIHLLDFLFKGGSEPKCLEAADSNNDGKIDVSDPIFLLYFLFLGGAAPPEPGPPGRACGPEPDSGDALFGLGCQAYAGC